MTKVWLLQVYDGRSDERPVTEVATGHTGRRMWHIITEEGECGSRQEQ
jgi:hypothetical protein